MIPLHFHFKPIYSVWMFLVGGGLGSLALAVLPIDQTTINNAFLAVIAISGAYTLWKTQQIKKVADAVHVLSNSAMGAQLISKVELLESLAVFARDAASKSPKAKAAADAIDVRVLAAKEELQKHLRQQAVVDSRK